MLGGDFPRLGSDNPRLRSDFPMLGSDFSRLGSDFPRLGNDFPRLRNDFPRLGNDCPRLGSDFSRLGNDCPRLGKDCPRLRNDCSSSKNRRKSRKSGVLGTFSPLPCLSTCREKVPRKRRTGGLNRTTSLRRAPSKVGDSGSLNSTLSGWLLWIPIPRLALTAQTGAGSNNPCGIAHKLKPAVILAGSRIYKGKGQRFPHERFVR